MSVLLLGVWFLLFLLAPGWGLARWILGGARRAVIEQVAFGLVLGAGLLTALGVVLGGMESLNRTSLAASMGIALVLSLALARRSSIRPSHGEGTVFWLALSIWVTGAIALFLPRGESAFGIDSYYWAGVGKVIAAGAFGEDAPWKAYPVIGASPSAYGYLLATAACLGVKLHEGAALIALGVLMGLWAFSSAFVLVSDLAGSRWGAVGAVLYLGSYWSWYFLLHTPSRQGIGLAIAPLLLLLLARKRTLAVRDPLFLVTFLVCWWLHAFTAFLLLCALAGVLIAHTFRRGVRKTIGELGFAGGLVALILFSVPILLLARIAGEVSGLYPIPDFPFRYEMDAASPEVLITTLGPFHVALLLGGWWGLRRELDDTRCMVGWSAAVLLVLLLFVGVFPQEWYKSTYIALPARRYYSFYPLVGISWLAVLASGGGTRLSGWLSSPRASGIALALALTQSLVVGGYAARMNDPRPDTQVVLEACLWLEQRTVETDAVAVWFKDPGTVTELAKGILAPRPVVVLNPDALPEQVLEIAGASHARFLLVDHEDAPWEEESRFRFEDRTAFVVRVPAPDRERER